MPANTDINDLLDMLRRLGCIHKARKAECELSHYRKHGVLPDGVRYIQRVMNVRGIELVELVELQPLE